VVDPAALTRLVMALPEAADGSREGGFQFSVAGKPLAWTYLERVAPKAPRRPRPDVLAVRCALPTKAMLIEAAPDRFFEDDHYCGYPAVLVRLEAVDTAELEGLLRAAWRLVAPKGLVRGVED
jgi:hypothetical protein